MKVYEGERMMAGTMVTVDGLPLPLRDDIKSFSKAFEWGFIGPGPKQLSLALLAEHLENEGVTLKLVESFERAVTSQLDNCWRVTSDDINTWIGEIKLEV